jgi:hypothetical protein
MKRSRIKQKATKRSKAGQQALQEFHRRWIGKPCWACPSLGHHKHHIVYRDGIAERDDQRNLAWLCFACHAAHHERGLTNFYDRTVNELTTEDILRLKRVKDREFWDLEFLRELSGRLDFGEGLE